jgi:hypothetical protein
MNAIRQKPDPVAGNSCTRQRTKHEFAKLPPLHEGRKRVLGFMDSILVARNLKTTEDLFDNRAGLGTEAMVADAVQWAERILWKIDNAFPGK